jgi:hypothetical protein
MLSEKAPKETCHLQPLEAKDQQSAIVKTTGTNPIPGPAQLIC